VDLFQLTLLFNSMRFKENTLENLAERLGKKGFDVPKPAGRGEDVPRWYEDKEYEKIEKHLEQDLKITRYIDLAMMSKLHENEELGNKLFDIISGDLRTTNTKPSQP
jgi:hypothetical protein